MADIFYVEEGYWEVGYAVYVAEANLVAFNTASLNATAGKLVEATIQLGDYIEVGYFNPNDYYNSTGSVFALTADGEIAAAVGVTKEFEAVIITSSGLSVLTSLTKLLAASLSVQSEVTATISHIEGADLFAFAESTLSAIALRSRASSATISSESTVSASADRYRLANASLTAESSLSSNSGKLIEATILLNPYIDDGYYDIGYFNDFGIVSSLEITADILAPSFTEAEASLASEFTVYSLVTKVKQFAISVSSSTSLSATISHIEGADLQAFTNASLSASAKVTRSLESALVVESTTQIDTTKLKLFVIDSRGYIEDTYYDAGYFETNGMEATVSINAGKSVEAICSLTVTASMTATISHIEGADLFAFAEAQLAIEVSRIRSNNAELASQFDLAADGVRGIYISAQADSEFALVSIGARSRAYEAAVDAAFSLDAVNARTRDVASDNTITSELTASLGIIKEFDAGLEVEGFVLTSFGRIRPELADLESAFSLTVDIIKSAEVNADLASETSLTSVITKTFGEFSVACASEFTSTATSVITAIGVASLDTSSQVITNNERTRDFSSTQASEFTTVTIADSGLIGQADLTVTTALDCTITKNIGAITANLTSQFTAVVNVFVIPSGGAFCETVSTQVTDANRLRDNNIAAEITTAITIDAVIVASAESSLASESQLSLVPLRIQQLDSEFESIASDLFIINKIGNGLIHSDIVATLDSIIVKTATGIAAMDATTALAVTANANKPFTSTQTVSSNITTNANVITDATADLQSEITTDIQANKQVVVASAIDVQSTLTATVAFIGDGISLEFSFADMDVSARVIKGSPATLASTSSLTATAGIAYVGNAALIVTGFQLTVGRKIQLQTAEVYIVPRENRTWTIGPMFTSTNEIIYVIPNETRSWTIKEETNSWTIESEQRTYTI